MSFGGQIVSFLESIGENAIKLFTTKKGIAGILILLVIAGGVWKYQFSMTPGEEEFKTHVEKATENVVKGSQLEMEAIKMGSEDNYDVELELLGMAIDSFKTAQNELNLAHIITQDEGNQNWVKCMNKTLDYITKRAEKISEGAQLELEGREDDAMELLDEIYELNDLAEAQRTRCREFETKEIVEMVK